MSRRDDFYTNTEADAGRFEAGHAPSRMEEAEAAGYDPHEPPDRPDVSDEAREAVRRAYDAVAELRGWGE